MQPAVVKCIKGVGHHICCPYCTGYGIKYGRSRSGCQRYFCKTCGKTYLSEYRHKAYLPVINTVLIRLLKEGCGIRSMSRLLCIAPGTVTARIRNISSTIKRPCLSFHKTYEMDEMSTYIGNKKNRLWVAYALCRENGIVADFRVGSRSMGTLCSVVETLLLSQTAMICTDKLNLYRLLVPASIHQTKLRSTNQVMYSNCCFASKHRYYPLKSILFKLRLM